MKFLLTGDPMVTERLQKGTDILIQETSGESAEQSLSISVTFQDADELTPKEKETASPSAARNLLIISGG